MCTQVSWLVPIAGKVTFHSTGGETMLELDKMLSKRGAKVSNKKPPKPLLPHKRRSRFKHTPATGVGVSRDSIRYKSRLKECDESEGSVGGGSEVEPSMKRQKLRGHKSGKVLSGTLATHLCLCQIQRTQTRATPRTARSATKYSTKSTRSRATLSWCMMGKWTQQLPRRRCRRRAAARALLATLLAR